MPDARVFVRKVFGIKFGHEGSRPIRTPDEHVPDFDPDYLFDRDTTLAILAGFAFNRRVMIAGYHGTGKSTHIEQVAARLNWPLVRINLDSHVSRIDLVGKDAIVLKDGKQITEFRDGILPWALQNNIALCFDEYDAGRPDVMFVIQRVLEVSGRVDAARSEAASSARIPAFRLFATANTVGLGDTSGLYHGTQQINEGQMDRWSIVATLNYLPGEHRRAAGSSSASATIDQRSIWPWLIGWVPSIEPARVAKANRVRRREQAETRDAADDAALVEQREAAGGFEHALNDEHHVGAAGIIFVKRNAMWLENAHGKMPSRNCVTCLPSWSRSRPCRPDRSGRHGCRG